MLNKSDPQVVNNTFNKKDIRRVSGAATIIMTTTVTTTNTTTVTFIAEFYKFLPKNSLIPKNASKKHMSVP